MRWVALMAALAMAVRAAAQTAAAQTAQPTVLASACSTCHGGDLKGAGSIPALRGHDSDYLKRALAEFRAGQRPATVMTRLMKGFSDAEIEVIAEHIGAKK